MLGKWDDPTAQKATADAIAVHKKFDGITAQGGDTGVVQAMIDAKHPFVPFGGETENGFRKFCAKYAGDGLKCSSAGTGPAQVAVAIKTAIAALEGQVVPQSVKLPLAIVEDPNFKEGQDFYPDQSDNFFVGNSFPTCGINFSAQEIMGQTQGKPVASRLAMRWAPRVRSAAPSLGNCYLGGPMDAAEKRSALPHGRRVQALWRRARAGEGASLSSRPAASTPSLARTAPANRR